MLAEPLAVIRGDGQQRLRLEAETLERVVQLADERVGVRDFAVIGSIAIARRVRLGRLVRIVRLVEVDPQEDAVGRALALEPRDRRAQRVSAGLLQRAQEVGVLRSSGNSSSYRSNPRAESAAPLQHDGRNERRGAKPGALQDLGEERRRRQLGRRQVVANAQLPRQQARRRSWRGTGASAGRGPSRWPHTPPRARSDRAGASDPRRRRRRRGRRAAYRW